MTEKELYEEFSKSYGEMDDWDGMIDRIVRERLHARLMNLARLPESTSVPFRAGYMLEKAYLRNPEKFSPLIPRFYDDFCTLTHPGAWRHYGKLMSLILRSATRPPTDSQAERIAETAVLRLVDETTKVAVRVWSLDILDRLGPRVPWIAEELPGVVDRLRLDPGPAMLSRLKRHGWVRD